MLYTRKKVKYHVRLYEGIFWTACHQVFILDWLKLFSEIWAIIYKLKMFLCENDRDTAINMIGSCHLWFWKFIPVVTTSLVFLAVKFFFKDWMCWFYAWNMTKVYMSRLTFVIIIQFPGLLWLLVEYFSDTKFSCHCFFLFLYILKYVSFLLENEFGRFRLLKHPVWL